MKTTLSTRGKYVMTTVHVLAWLLILNMHFMTFDNRNSPMTVNEYLFGMIFPVFFAIVFYVNYFFLIPRMLFPKRLLAFFVANILLIGTSAVLLETTLSTLRPSLPRRERIAGPPNDFRERRPVPMERPDRADFRDGGPGRPNPLGMIFRMTLMLGMISGVAVAIKTTMQWFQSEDLRKDLEREHLKSELDNLRNQLSPHFFFNTLNNIYSLISQNQDKAQQAVHQLSKLMRYLLYDSNDKYVSLNREIAFMNSYIDLMKLRLTPNVTVRYSFSNDNASISIAPLLFISLIENSFKHGISLNHPSEIDIRLQVNTNNELTFWIRNTSFPKNDQDRSGSGIGIENLKRRLRLLYPNQHTLEIATSDAYYETTLKVQL